MVRLTWSVCTWRESVAWLQLVFHVREVVLQVHAGDFLAGHFDLAPLVNFETQVLIHNIGMAVADNDGGALLDDIELFVLGKEHNAAVLVTYFAFSLSDP